MAEFVVGVDLGTTNTVVAFARIEGGALESFPLPQLVAPGELAAGLSKLPSAVYLPAVDEFPDGATALPWGEPPTFEQGEGRYFLGAFASVQGAKVPGRQIVSAKSWLSYAAVDRRAPTLPWGGLEDVPRMSPVEVSARILAHVRAAWNRAHPEAPLEHQEVILTVPASFDEVARNLTVDAAHKAGIASLRLVEEPQAAFYDYIRRHSDNLLEALGDARLVLVVDVGGGTTDLTLVQVVREEGKPPRLERIAVGEHLMLGGDNMDATLARHVEKELTGTLGSLSAAQWGQLVQSSRLAKETLLADDAPDSCGVTLAARGKKLLGGQKICELDRATAEALILDGFLPATRSDEEAGKRTRAALSSVSLPYESDTAIPRHIASFLRKHRGSAAESGVPVYGELPKPDAVLLNGGVFQSPRIRRRLMEAMGGWFDGANIPVWAGDDGGEALDLAVARGAAYYGLVRHGLGVRIGGGAARAYFIGVTDDDGRDQALCVVPRGLQEGAELEVDRTFRLVLGKPVSFPLYASTSDARRKSGELVPVGEAELDRLPPLQTVLTAPTEVPVRLKAHFTEVGTLELSLEMTPESLSRWQLDFSTRAEEIQPQAEVAKADAALPAKMDEAKDLVAGYFGDKSKDVDPATVKQLRRKLEKLLGPREEWSLLASRELFGVLIAGAKRRRRSAEHERVFFQLAGYCLRPGFGAPLDDWRVSELFALFEPGVQYVKEKPNWAEFWLMWRRVAGGLTPEQQRAIFDAVKWHAAPKSKREGKAPPGPKPEGYDEMVRMLAALERLPAETKVELGEWVRHGLKHGVIASWWPLGRLGARTLMRGSAHEVVPPRVAATWLEDLLASKWLKEEGAAFAAMQIARLTGDRERDIDEELRERVARKLEELKSPEAWIRVVREVVPISVEDEAQMLGDSLPVGLKLA